MKHLATSTLIAARATKGMHYLMSLSHILQFYMQGEQLQYQLQNSDIVAGIVFPDTIAVSMVFISKNP